MWHCSAYGTHSLDEEEVLTISTGAWGYWVEYRPNEPTMLGYAIEVTGYDDAGDSVVGNVYEVGEYAQHTAYVRQAALPLESVSLTYSNDWGINAGQTITVPKREYDKDRHRLMSESGNVVGIKYHPNENRGITMAERLQSEHRKRMCMQIGDPEEHLQKIDKKLAEIRAVPEQPQKPMPVADKAAHQAQNNAQAKQNGDKASPPAEKTEPPKKPKKPNRGDDR
jgi:hypothetical protein